MIEQLTTFFYMNGHGAYVFTAYGCVILTLSLQWFLPWRRFRLYQQKLNAMLKNHE